MDIFPIAYAHNGFTDKFGIPRQSRAQDTIETRIVFEKPYAKEDAIRGIEGYSHLWLIWGFDKADKQKLIVRPPRLGGNTRMGVFATRSPFRPNRLGLSSVRLVGIERQPDSLALVVTGADLLDGTPIYDIKPYLSFSDCHEDAVNGFAEDTKDYRLPVVWDGKTEAIVVAHNPSAKDEIEDILSQDPRPGYQNDSARVYKMEYSGWHVEFTVENKQVHIKMCILTEK
mgnify:CR=1 FL=1